MRPPTDGAFTLTANGRDADLAEALIAAAADLRDDCTALIGSFDRPVAHVYLPVDYAWDVHRRFIERYGALGRGRVLLLGMNPGPWGMAQTGVPFGDPHIVGEWLGITGEVSAPPEAQRHPKREIQGFDSDRREVSGTRLYTMAREAFGGVEGFFQRFWLVNYCPLIFFDAGGRNLTPPRLKAADRQRVFEVCDRHLIRVADAVCPPTVIGIGKFAERRLSDVLGDRDCRVGGVLHPSPASPKANRGWQEQALADLATAGIEP